MTKSRCSLELPVSRTGTAAAGRRLAGCVVCIGLQGAGSPLAGDCFCFLVEWQWHEARCRPCANLYLKKALPSRSAHLKLLRSFGNCCVPENSGASRLLIVVLMCAGRPDRNRVQ